MALDSAAQRLNNNGGQPTCLDCSGCREEISGQKPASGSQAKSQSLIRRADQKASSGFTGGALCPKRLIQPVNHAAVDWEDWPEESQPEGGTGGMAEDTPEPRKSTSCLACGGTGCGMCQAKSDPRVAACLACGGIGCGMCQATATPSNASCIACGGSGCGVCQEKQLLRRLSCLACGGNGCSMCKEATNGETHLQETPAALSRRMSCLACGGNGCSMCRDRDDGCETAPPPPPQKGCVSCGGHGCSLCK